MDLDAPGCPHLNRGCSRICLFKRGIFNAGAFDAPGVVPMLRMKPGDTGEFRRTACAGKSSPGIGSAIWSDAAAVVNATIQVKLNAFIILLDGIGCPNAPVNVLRGWKTRASPAVLNGPVVRDGQR